MVPEMRKNAIRHLFIAVIVLILTTNRTSLANDETSPKQSLGILDGAQLQTLLIGRTVRVLYQIGHIHFINETDGLHRGLGADATIDEIKWRIHKNSLACFVLPSIHNSEICIELTLLKSGNYRESILIDKAVDHPLYNFRDAGPRYMKASEFVEGNTLN